MKARGRGFSKSMVSLSSQYDVCQGSHQFGDPQIDSLKNQLGSLSGQQPKDIESDKQFRDVLLK